MGTEHAQWSVLLSVSDTQAMSNRCRRWSDSSSATHKLMAHYPTTEPDSSKGNEINLCVGKSAPNSQNLSILAMISFVVQKHIHRQEHSKALKACHDLKETYQLHKTGGTSAIAQAHGLAGRQSEWLLENQTVQAALR